MEREFLLGCLQARIEDRNIKLAETIKHLGSEAAKLKHATSQLDHLEAQLRTAQAETLNSETDNNTNLTGCIVGRSAALKCLQSLP